MNIPELSMALANVQLTNQVGIAVLDKALESSEVSGESLIGMMEHSMELSVNPGVGGNIDMVLVRKWGDRQLNQMSNSPLILTSRFV